MGEASRKIAEAETIIEDAVWQSVQDDDHEKEMEEYKRAKSLLESIKNLTYDQQKEHDRVMAYCLMRIGNAQGVLEKETDEELSLESLRLAERSEDAVQIARSLLYYGIWLLNHQRLSEAEKKWRRVFQIYEQHKEDRDMKQVIGWTLVVRANVLMGKSLYTQALLIGEKAEGILAGIKNYAGMAAANRVQANAHRALGDMDAVERCEKLAEHYREMAKRHRA